MTNNPVQCHELLEKFKMETRWWGNHLIWSAKPYGRNLCGEAITACAIEIMKGESDD